MVVHDHSGANKGLMFFSAGSPSDCNMLMDMGIKDILVSYFYLQKRRKVFEEEILPRIKEMGGYFMTDSGGFSFLNSVARVHEMRSEEYWLPYLHEYVEWLEKFRDHIYVAANLDLDVIVGRDVVDKWNTRLFIDLEKSVNVTYVAHKDKIFRKGAGYPHADPSGLNRVREYAKAFDYIGVSEEMKERHASVYAIAAANNARVHGFAWTSIPLLKMHPMFSVDSTTWLGGVKYGTTYAYDGKNFRVIDYKKKYRRKSHKIRCEDKGLDYDGLIADEGKAVTKFNLESWKGARTEYLRSANSKLRTNTVASYDHRRDY